jgi:hypothetical protein
MASSKQPMRFKRTIAVLVGSAMLAIAAFMTIQSVRAVWFRPVRGTVIAKRLQSNVVGRINLHRPIVEYSYVVGGVQYQNDAFTLLDDDGTEQWATLILEEYTVGTPCTVYYSPLNPKTSVLSKWPTPRCAWITLCLAILGVCHLLGGLFFY